MSSVSVVAPCIAFCEKFLRFPLPYGAQKFVFVDEALDDIASQ
jgi:hypothetical protein